MQAFYCGDGVDKVALAERAHDVGVQGAQVQPTPLALLHPPLPHLALDGLGGLLDGGRDLHPVLVLEGRGPRAPRLLLHRFMRTHS